VRGLTTVNTWITKTFLKKNCEAYLKQLDMATLDTARKALESVRKTERVHEWRHYCGLEPRYWDISVRDDGTIVFEGGLVWHAEVKDGVLYTDGCVTRGMLIDVVDKGIRQLSSLKCR
jgi:hypothetical protein